MAQLSSMVQKAEFRLPLVEALKIKVIWMGIMQKYYKFAVFLLALISVKALGADVSSGVYTIKSVRVSNATGLTYINPSSSVNVKNNSCTYSDMFAIHQDAQSYSQIYSALLTAATASKPVEIWVSVDADDCLNGRQRINVVQVNF